MIDHQRTPDLEDIYRQLLGGVGHQWVTDDNVTPLIEMAASRGDRLIEVELREWQTAVPKHDPRDILHSTQRPGRPVGL